MTPGEGTRALTWLAGIDGEAIASTQPNSGDVTAGWVRVSCAPGIFRVFVQPNTGARIGPWEAPCWIPCEIPTTVIVDRVVAAATPVIATVTWGPRPPTPQTLRRSLALVAATSQPLEAWETAVELENPAAVLDWLDAGGAVLSSVGGGGPWLRPRLAAAIRSDLTTLGSATT